MKMILSFNLSHQRASPLRYIFWSTVDRRLSLTEKETSWMKSRSLRSSKSARLAISWNANLFVTDRKKGHVHTTMLPFRFLVSPKTPQNIIAHKQVSFIQRRFLSAQTPTHIRKEATTTPFGPRFKAKYAKLLRTEGNATVLGFLKSSRHTATEGTDLEYIYKSLICYQRRIKQFPEIIADWEEMQAKNLSADLTIHNIVMGAYFRVGQIEGGLKIWEKIQQKFEPDSYSYITVMNMYQRKGLFQEIIRLYETIDPKIIDRGIQIIMMDVSMRLTDVKMCRKLLEQFEGLSKFIPPGNYVMPIQKCLERKDPLCAAEWSFLMYDIGGHAVFGDRTELIEQLVSIGAEDVARRVLENSQVSPEIFRCERGIQRTRE